ncbi:uridine phosphorylase 1-like [Glandiceps talaboti]
MAETNSHQTQHLVNSSISHQYVNNPHLNDMESDHLYHFGLSTLKDDLPAMFGDVKFVCCGGSPFRMEAFAKFMLQELHMHLPAGLSLSNICSTDRYTMYKVGPVLAVSHGMGMPSISIMLHEIFKLVYYAKCTDVVFLRIGTCGGLGLQPGSVVITSEAVDYKFDPCFQLPVLGQVRTWPTKLSQTLAEEIQSCSNPEDSFETVIGKTLCTDDFYEGQARLDGAFCGYDDNDKMEYLQKAHELGVKNVEMESLCFASMTNRGKIMGAVICVTLLDRLQGDQVTTQKNDLGEWQERPQQLVARFITKRLKECQSKLDKSL